MSPLLEPALRPSLSFEAPPLPSPLASRSSSSRPRSPSRRTSIASPSCPRGCRATARRRESHRRCGTASPRPRPPRRTERRPLPSRGPARPRSPSPLAGCARPPSPPPRRTSRAPCSPRASPSARRPCRRAPSRPVRRGTRLRHVRRPRSCPQCGQPSSSRAPACAPQRSGRGQRTRP